MDAVAKDNSNKRRDSNAERLIEELQEDLATKSAQLNRTLAQVLLNADFTHQSSDSHCHPTFHKLLSNTDESAKNPHFIH